MSTLSKMSDAELVAWAKNLIDVAGANPTQFGLTAALITDLQTTVTTLENNMAARYAAEEVAAAAVTAQQMSRQTLEPKCSYARTTVKSNPTVPDDKKVLAGAPPDKAATYTPPTTPDGLIANPHANGSNVLKWGRNGNKQGTQYIVEYQMGAATEFTFLGTTTETTYTHLGVTPGVQCAYRVKAQRANEQSMYSNVAVVYLA